MKETKWYKKPEMIVALSALLMSLVTTIVGIYSASIDRAYARASIWPRLEMYENSANKTFSYGITNSGNGPALIKYVTVTHNKKPIKHWSDIPNFPQITQSYINSRILAPQKTVMPLKADKKGFEIIRKIDKDMTITICYCSIYDECWLTTKEENKPTPIEHCEVDDALKFEQ